MKKIQLSGHRKGSTIKGYVLVDDDDFEWLNKYKWHCNKYGYAVKTHKKLNGIRSKLFMHGLLIYRFPSMQVDHINGNKLDNRKENLRIVTPQQNTWNTKKSKSNTSGYRGVYWHSQCKKWYSQIRTNKKKTIHLGMFNNKEDAASAYNKAALIQRGKFAMLNNI